MMYPEIQKINVESDVARITTPLLLIAGRHDAEVPYFGLKAGFDRWGGEKEFIAFDRSGHVPFVDETDRFVREVSRFLGK
jgi:proline iminopeptidase